MQFIVAGVVVLAALTFFGLRNNLAPTVEDSRPITSTASNGTSRLAPEADVSKKPVAPRVRSLTSAAPPPAPSMELSAIPEAVNPPRTGDQALPGAPPESKIKKRAPTRSKGEPAREDGPEKSASPISSSSVYTER
jgi:hypothetical protein